MTCRSVLRAVVAAVRLRSASCRFFVCLISLGFVEGGWKPTALNFSLTVFDPFGLLIVWKTSSRVTLVADFDDGLKVCVGFFSFFFGL